MTRKVNWLKIIEGRNLMKENNIYIVKNTNHGSIIEDRIAIAKREYYMIRNLFKL